MTKSYNCAVIGDWHLAFVTAGVLSHLKHRTVLVNPNSQWKEFPALPVSEPGLAEMFQQSRSEGLLDFANGITQDWSADFIWMAIDTPVNAKDEADVTSLIEVARQVRKNHPAVKAFITSSQIPIGFCRQLETEFQLPVVYIPENLRLGKGIETLLNADNSSPVAPRLRK